MSAEDRLAQRLAELRNAFDATFAAPLLEREEGRQIAITIRAGDTPFAVRLSDIAGVEACRRVVLLPDGMPGLLGLAGIRGQLVAVYDLAALLVGGGAASRAGRDPARWMLLCAASREIGLAIDRIEGYVRFASTDVSAPSSAAMGEQIREVLRHNGVLYGIIDLAWLVRAIEQKAQSGRATVKGDS